MGVRTLILDLETQPSSGYVWQMFDNNLGLNQIIEPGKIISWAALWAGEDTVDYSSINITTHKKMIYEIWKLMDEADEVVGWNCLEVSTPVLTQDLRWVPVGELKEGDKIVGFDEGKPMGEIVRPEGTWKGSSNVRKIKPAVVTGHKIVDAECVEVVLENGDVITTTLDHGWLSMGPKDNNHRWRTSSQLEPGYRAVKLTGMWEEDTSRDAGWLSGFLDGEGSFGQKGKSGGRVSFVQASGAVWDKALQVLDSMGIPVDSIYRRQPRIGPIKGNKVVNYACIGGGKWKSVETLGRVRPERFSVDWESFGTVKGKQGDGVAVVEVRPVGIKKIAVMSTSTKTFIAAGYAMHNCNSFDIKLLNAAFAVYGFGPPSPYKKVDLMRIVKSQMKFLSNKLDFVSGQFGIGHKMEHEGFGLWVKCMEGDQKAWDTMHEYNVMDVVLTEKMYDKLRGWITVGVNRSNLTEKHVCPSCGSDHVQKRGTTVSMVRTYIRWHCQSCGSWSRSAVAEDRVKPNRKVPTR